MLVPSEEQINGELMCEEGGIVPAPLKVLSKYLPLLFLRLEKGEEGNFGEWAGGRLPALGQWFPGELRISGIPV